MIGILFLGISLLLIGLFYQNFMKYAKKVFRMKHLEKIIVLSSLTITILFVLSGASYYIAKFFKFNPKYIGSPMFGERFYGFWLWFRFLFVKGVSQNSYLNNVYLFSTSILCLTSLPFFIYMIKKDGTLDTHGTARWAKLWEWDEAGLLCSPKKYKDGVILGIKKSYFSSKVIIDSLKTHIAVVAPSRSGKGTGIIIPTLLNWRGSTFTLDMKGENFQITAGYRKKVLKQKVLLFKPYGLEGSVSYNPLAEVRIGEPYEVKDATIIADILTDPGEGKKRDHWDTSASALFVGLILHVLYAKKKEGKTASFGDIVDFLTDSSTPLDKNFGKLLSYNHEENSDVFKTIYEPSQMEGVPEGTHPLVARTAAEILNKDERERASVISTVMAKLGLFKDPIIRKNTSQVHFRIKDLMDYETPVSFYVVVEAEQMDTLGPLLRILVTQMIGLLCPEMDFSTDASIHKHKLLLMMDEFPAFGTIPLFEKALAYIAGYGLKAVVIAQALNQIKKNYGDKNSVFDNCATTVFYAPTPLDTETPKQVSEMLGDTTIKVKNKSYKSFQLAGINISESNQARRLLTPEEVKNKVAGKWNIISITGMYPMMGEKMEYWREKYFIPKTHKVLGIPTTDYLYQNAEENSPKETRKNEEETKKIEEQKKAVLREEEAMEMNNQKYIADVQSEVEGVVESIDFENTIPDPVDSTKENIEGMTESLEDETTSIDDYDPTGDL